MPVLSTSLDVYGWRVEEFEEIVKTLSTDVVVANKTANVKVLLQQGESLSGTVRYDDGSLTHVEWICFAETQRANGPIP